MAILVSHSHAQQNNSSHNNSSRHSNTHRKQPAHDAIMHSTSSAHAAASGGDVTYNANAAAGHGGALRRIRSPAPHDVLSGRGGSVNAHPGNCQFRDWVYVRKADYNLAHAKQDKADICREVIAQVAALGGRFLTKERAAAGGSTSLWWVELDDDRVMAKTSQALREGAPRIREAHRDEIGTRRRTNTTTATAASSLSTTTTTGADAKRQRQTAATTTTSTSHPKRSLSDETAEDSADGVRRPWPLQREQAVSSDSNKRLRIDPNSAAPARIGSMPAAPTLLRVRDYQLMPAPSEQSTHISSNNNSKEMPSPFTPLPRRFSSNLPTMINHRSQLSRTNSLTMSDVAAEDVSNDDFVNPFEDESELLAWGSSSLGGAGRTSSYSSSRSSLGLPPPRPGVWRESSTASSAGDMAGLGALMRSSDSNSSNNNINSKSAPSLGPFFRSESSKTIHHNDNNGNGALRINSRLGGNTMGTGNSSRYAQTTISHGDEVSHDDDDNDDDDRSVSSISTLGLALWEWFNRDVPASTHHIPVSPHQ